LTNLVAARFAPDAAVEVLDLAAGAGANKRYLTPHLPARQHWLLADHDGALLARAAADLFPWGRPQTRTVDLAALDDRDLFAGRTLVTASALLDLVSNEWLEWLAQRCRDASAIVLFALTYDGGIECSPAHADDGRVRDLVNRHQRIDKGFGPALGPAAVEVAERAFVAAGYHVERARSDWVLTESMQDLQHQLIAGWADVACAVAPHDSKWIERWRTYRFEQLAAGHSRLVVGHEDLAAWVRVSPQPSALSP
jgi:hypothetical protein